MERFDLIINEKNHGSVFGYYQDRDTQAWVIDMNGGYSITIPFCNIKLFTSSGNLEIITNKD